MFNRLAKKRPKVFCIGMNKTGTTSVERALVDLGYKMGDQSAAQGLIDGYASRNFRAIVDFCRDAEAFQDAPFSWHYTFMFLDQHYPDARFILTTRNNEHEWYDSLLSFHSKLFGKNGQRPTAEDLKQARRPGNRTVWDNMNIRHRLDESDPYKKEILVDYYLTHNKMVIDYFRHKNNLLVINLAEPDSYNRFCSFLNTAPLYTTFPWENKTGDV